MCIIVDINIAHRALGTKNDPDYGDIYQRLFVADRHAISLVYGGRLLREYVTSGYIVRLVALLDRSGRARAIADGDVDNEEQLLLAAGTCVSNDAHIIALSRTSGVRVLCTEDAALRTDFGNPALVARPRGKIYSRKSHKPLLDRVCK